MQDGVKGNRPMNKGTFGEEQIELAVKSSPRLGNRRRVTQHAHGSLYLGQVAVWYDRWRLVVDAHLYKHT